MKTLYRSLLVIGMALILLGLGSCVRFYWQGPDAHEPGLDGDAKTYGYTFFQVNFFIMSGGAIALSLGLYLRSTGKKRDCL